MYRGSFCQLQLTEFSLFSFFSAVSVFTGHASPRRPPRVSVPQLTLPPPWGYRFWTKTVSAHVSKTQQVPRRPTQQRCPGYATQLRATLTRVSRSRLSIASRVSRRPSQSRRQHSSSSVLQAASSVRYDPCWSLREMHKRKINPVISWTAHCA
jgi:hypothetical protein